MATESLYWASGQTFTLTNGTGAGTDIDDDPDSPDANWVTGSGNAIDLLVGFTSPSGNPTTGTNNQQFRAYIRQGANGPSPDWAMDVYENGTLRASAIATGTIANGTGGELVTGNWTFSGFTNADGSGVEIKIRQTAGSRNIDVGAVEWVCDYVVLKSVSDSLLPTISDTSSVAKLLFLARSDSLLPRIDDSSALEYPFTRWSRSDSLLPKIDDTSAIYKLVYLTPTDTLSPKIDEASSLNQLLFVSVFDYLQIDIPSFDYTYSQVENLRENDNVNTLFKFPFQMDMYGVQIGDFDTLAGTSFGLGYATGSIALGLITLGVSETFAMNLIDTGSIFSALARSDSLLPRIDDVSALEYPFTKLSRTDSLLPRIDEIVTLIVSFSAQDELLPRVDSLVSLLVSLARADAITPKIDEFVDVMNVTLSRNDSLPITITDLMSIYSAFTRDDALVMATTEVMTILSRLDRTDSLVLTSEEILKIFSFIVGRYRWRDDDGTEATATWLANEDTDVNRGININTRLRIQVDTSGGDTGSVTLKLQYRKTGDPDWEWRTVN